MSVVNDNIRIVVLVLDEPNAREIFLCFISARIRASRDSILPSLLRANGLANEYIHALASEISEMAETPILRRTLSQCLRECMQTHILHIESRYPQTMMPVVQKESGVLGSEVDARKRK